MRVSTPPTYGPPATCPACRPDDDDASGLACSDEHQAAISAVWQAVPAAILAIVQERAEAQVKRETEPAP